MIVRVLTQRSDGSAKNMKPKSFCMNGIKINQVRTSLQHLSVFHEEISRGQHLADLTSRWSMPASGSREYGSLALQLLEDQARKPTGEQHGRVFNFFNPRDYYD
jgi:hypothetical protein